VLIVEWSTYMARKQPTLWAIARSIHKITEHHARKGDPYEVVWVHTQDLWKLVEQAGHFSQRRVTQLLGDLAEASRLRDEAKAARARGRKH